MANLLLYIVTELEENRYETVFESLHGKGKHTIMNERMHEKIHSEACEEEQTLMIFKNTGLDGLKSDLAYLDESAEKVGFIRWQWEYYRATYDYKIEDESTKSEYFVRINTRVVDGKLEKPDSILAVEAVYLGKATFPHGLDYDSSVPQPVVKLANQKLQQLLELLQA